MSTQSLLLRQVRLEATAIHSFELVHPEGNDLPAFTAGAHIDLHLPGGLVRQYSLCNDPTERHRYVVAILKEDKGRGGSRTAHDQLRVGQRVEVSEPRNHFPLHPDTRHAVLIGGGIGITPLKSMAHALAAQGVSFELHSCARSAERAAFADELQALGHAQFHFDQGIPAQGLDLVSLLREPSPGTHLYYCGPAGFMAACASASAHWLAGTVHCEHFKAPEPAPGSAVDPPLGGFVAEIASTGQRIVVGASTSLSDALIDAGVFLQTSCISGLCGTCKVHYRSGDVEHHDHILSEEERSHCMTACVSRARQGLLVLEL
jgi:vanillate O-demethylase ferredoxin subunit